MEALKLGKNTHPIVIPTSPTRCLEMHDLTMALWREGATVRGAAVLVAACCPSIPDVPPWTGRGAWQWSEAVSDVLLAAGLPPHKCVDLVTTAGLVERLRAGMPSFASEVEEAEKNS